MTRPASLSALLFVICTGCSDEQQALGQKNARCASVFIQLADFAKTPENKAINDTSLKSHVTAGALLVGPERFRDEVGSATRAVHAEFAALQTPEARSKFLPSFIDECRSVSIESWRKIEEMRKSGKLKAKGI